MSLESVQRMMSTVCTRLNLVPLKHVAELEIRSSQNRSGTVGKLSPGSLSSYNGRQRPLPAASRVILKIWLFHGQQQEVFWSLNPSEPVAPVVNV